MLPSATETLELWVVLAVELMPEVKEETDVLVEGISVVGVASKAKAVKNN